MPRAPAYVSLKAKLAVVCVAVTLCCATIAGALVDRNVRRTAEASFEDRLAHEATMLAQMTASALFGDLDPSDTSLNESVHALGQAVHTELAVIARNGTVVADSQADDLRAVGSQASAPEIVSARESGAGTAVRDGRLFVARAITREGRTLGYARSAVPMPEVTASVRAVRTRMAWGSALALLVSVGLGLVFSSRLVRPIRALAEGARRVGAGDFDRAIEVSTNDEIGHLAASFNDMTRDLRRTVALLDRRNRDMRVVLDNVTQGLLTVDRAGVMSIERSAVIERWFGPAPEGASFVDHVLRGDPQAARNFSMQWEQLSEGWLPLELILDQLPKRLAREDHIFELSYTPIHESVAEGPFERLLVVIAEITARVAAERAEAEQREVASVLEWAARDKLGVLEFLLEAESLMRALTAEPRPSLAETKRTLHTLKGNSAIFGMQRFSALCHSIEDRMDESGGDMGPPDVAALREAWAARASRFSALLGNSAQIVVEDDDYRAVLKAILDGTSRVEVARMVREWRMERIGTRLERFAEQARDIGARLHKTVVVEVAPCALRAPRDEWSTFWSSFVHVVRNAVDHGIEPEADRLRMGKTAAGHIRLSATADASGVVVEVADDGRGIDWDAIAERAREVGLPARHPHDLVAALFADGVTSRHAATEVSGRGVGLASLRLACQAVGGQVTVDSERGRGTVFRFRLPVREIATPRAPGGTVPPPSVSAQA